MAAATKKRSNVPVISTKMDLAKALGILGFTSTRWLDQSSGLDPKEELDKAHFNQMMEITRKRKQQKVSWQCHFNRIWVKICFQKEEKQKEEEGKKAAKDPKTALALSAPAQPPAKRYAAKRKEFSVDDEVRILHEAYQFLLRKYKLGSYAEEDGEPSTDVVSFTNNKYICWCTHEFFGLGGRVFEIQGRDRDRTKRGGETPASRGAAGGKIKPVNRRHTGDQSSKRTRRIFSTEKEIKLLNFLTVNEKKLFILSCDCTLITINSTSKTCWL